MDGFADFIKGDLIVGKAAKPRYSGLDDTITMLSGDDKRNFLRFIARMLEWLPEDRATAKELLADPWLDS